MISVIIPTYKSPEALNLCLKSSIEGQVNNNQIIVVVDGFYDINSQVLNHWKEYIEILDLKENVGLSRGTNLGVYNSKYDKILIVNDDNVFPRNWDVALEKLYERRIVWAPNQIEPYVSIFKQFHINDLGRKPDTFDINAFWEYSSQLSTDKQEFSGSTLPIFMSKMDYLTVGGWDENYEMGLVADWDFFLKCQLAGFKMLRTYNCHFYHFVSLTTLTNESQAKRIKSEQDGHEYAKYKWGTYIKNDLLTNLKFL